jgi:hypothetical protein
MSVGVLRGQTGDVASKDSRTKPIAETTTADLVNALRGVVAEGLPATEATAGDLLLNLRSVYARAVIPQAALSRLHALNQLLPRLIASLDDARYREAVQMLFGLSPGTRGTTLTARRRQSAVLMDYSVDHFRARVEQDLLQGVALAVHEDLLRYVSRVKRASESLEPTGDTPQLGPEHINAEEELISRIWQHVYGLRAEIIAVQRLRAESGYDAQAGDHSQAAERMREGLRSLLADYTQTYREKLLRHGDAEYALEALERLATWRG